MKTLTQADIISTVGEEVILSNVTNLEILFLSFEEIASLHCLPNLEKLSFIDNGIKTISNLDPVSLKLRSLTICDQQITSIDSGAFNLPHLVDLHLHRNQITFITGFSGCPRLRKLWIFQNKIKDLKGFQDIPHLEELWIQADWMNTTHQLSMIPPRA